MALIHHYKLENDLTDSIGGLTATCTTDVSYDQAKIRNGAILQSHQLVLPNFSFSPTDDFSYSIWFKLSNLTTAAQTLLCNRVKTGTGITVFIIGKKLRFDTENQTTYSTELQPNIMYNVTVVRRGNTKRVYLNGIEEVPSTGTNNITAPNIEVGTYTTIGASYTPITNFLTGIIDDVRIYDHALSEREVRDLNLGLVAHFKFDNDLYDHAQYTLGKPLNEPVYGKGKFGNALMRTTGYNRVDLETPINITDGVSYAFWLYYDYDTQGTAEIAPVSTNINKFHSIVHRNSRKIGAFDGSWRLSNYIVPDKEWHHYAYVLSNGVIALYVDGEYFGNISVPNLVEPIYSVAGSIVGSNRQPAMMEDLRIFTTSISAETIKEIYQQRLSIDSQGNMYTAHLDETTGSDLPMSITNGSLLCTVSEVDDAGNPLNSFSIDGSTVHTKEIREC